MTDHNEAALRRKLEQYDTPKLDEMLREALEKEPADGPAVRQILRILKEREAGMALEYGPETEIALEKYRKKLPKSRPQAKTGWLYRAAAVAAAICLILLAIPQNVAAESFFERLMRWTDSIFELFSPGEENAAPEYEFRTAHPGLQQVYDAVTELGITAPVVPMWIPEEYELAESNVDKTRSKTSVSAEFISGDKNVIFDFTIHSHLVSNEYYKDFFPIQTVELAGITHNILQNEDVWVVVWIRDNLECFIHIDCREDVLYEILRSIYVMEE